MLAGFLTAVIWVIALKQHFYDLYEMIPGFAAGFLATIVVSLLTEPPEGADDEFNAVWNAIGKSQRPVRAARPGGIKPGGKSFEVMLAHLIPSKEPQSGRLSPEYGARESGRVLGPSEERGPARGGGAPRALM